jgi:uncharacterized membrane protein YbhN (UPF0104 family)
VSAPSPTPVSPSPTRRRLILLAKILVSAALLWLLVARSDVPRLWAYARSASVPWLAVALGLYFLMVVASAWRWGLLLDAQGVHLRPRALTESFLVATFINNFLPSNIGGDVVRIADTAKPARSRTLAASVVLVDRGIGLLGLVLLAAVAATVATSSGSADGPVPSYALWLGFAAAVALAVPAVLAPHGLERVLNPLRAFHPVWVGARLQQLTGVFTRFRQAPGALAGCFAGAVLVQGLLVAFYAAVAHSINVPVSPWHMAVVVPMSFLVQMLPISVNGFGLREATFSFYFTRLGLPIEAALVVSLVGAGLVMLFSLSGAAVYVTRGT